MQGPGRVSSGSDVEVAAHDNGPTMMSVRQGKLNAHLCHPSTHTLNHHHKHLLNALVDLAVQSLAQQPSASEPDTYKLHVFPILPHARFLRL